MRPPGTAECGTQPHRERSVSDDSEAARLSRIVRFIAWAIAIGAIPSVAHNALSGRWSSALVLVVAQGGVLTAIAWVRRGHLNAATWLLVTVVQVCAAALVVVGGHGFHDVAMLLFPATLVVAGLLLGRWAFAGVSVATVAFVLAIGLSETSGLVVTELSPFTHGRNLLDAAVILSVTALAVGLLAESVRTSLARANEKESAAAAANADLLEQARLLQASEERFRSLIDLAVDGILIGDTQRRVIGANRRMLEITGYEASELVGRSVAEFFSPEASRRTPLRFDAIESGETVVNERLLLRKDGTAIPVEMSSKKMPDGTYQSFFRDITERRRAEEEQCRLRDEIRQAQKMEAVGRLAGGIAHDFNNMLMVVQSTVGLALRKAARGSFVHQCLLEAEQAAERASGLTRQLLMFGRRQAIAPRLVDLHALVLNLRPMLDGVLGGDVELDVMAPATIHLVIVDVGQLEQALVNLALNAHDAMPQGGRLRIVVSELNLSEDRAAALRLKPGPHVTLEVIDTGTGMTPEVHQHLFEPFFTTKPAGTGLGLATVYGTMRENHGAIEVDSLPGRGTTFRLLFPFASQEAGRSDPPLPREAPTVPGSSACHGRDQNALDAGPGPTSMQLETAESLDEEDVVAEEAR
jgi:PAS domain S-box-containing protein